MHSRAPSSSSFKRRLSLSLSRAKNRTTGFREDLLNDDDDERSLSSRDGSNNALVLSKKYLPETKKRWSCRRERRRRKRRHQKRKERIWNDKNSNVPSWCSRPPPLGESSQNKNASSSSRFGCVYKLFCFSVVFKVTTTVCEFCTKRRGRKQRKRSERTNGPQNKGRREFFTI